VIGFGIDSVEHLSSATKIFAGYKLWFSVTAGNLMLI
jgi:hypothetical protein